MNSKFDTILDAILNNIQTVRGEIYKFVRDNKKRSSTIARKCLSNIMTQCKTMRAELQQAVKLLPTRPRNMTPERRKEIALKRKATIEAKKEARRRKK